MACVLLLEVRGRGWVESDPDALTASTCFLQFCGVHTACPFISLLSSVCLSFVLMSAPKVSTGSLFLKGGPNAF